MRLFVAVSLSLYFLSAHAAEISNPSSLIGKWKNDANNKKDSFTFYANGDFAFAYPKGNDTPVITTRKGAYSVGKEICTVGDGKGNLWIAADSERCCINAYFMSNTLVFDQVRDSRAIRMPVGAGSLCESRTFSKVREQ